MTIGTIPATPGVGLLFAVDTAAGVSTAISKIAVGPAGTNSIVGDGSVTMPVTDTPVAGLLTSILSAQATAAAQATAQTTLTAIQGDLAGAATASAQGTGNTLLAGIASLLGGTLEVAAASLPLPTGAATASAQASAQTTLTAIAGSVAAPPLSTGAATAANQATQTTALGLLATAATQATQSTTLSAIAASVAAPPLPTGAATQTTLAAILTALGAALPLPTGGATAANQATVIADLVTALASLATIATNTAPVSAGQKTMANSLSFATSSDDSNLGPGTTSASLAVTGAPQNLFAAVSVLPFAMAYIHLTVLGTGNTFSAEGSNDGVTYTPLAVTKVDNPGVSPASTTFNSAGMYAIPLGFAFLKVVCTVYGSGSPVATLCLSPRPIANPTSYPLVTTPVGTTTQGSGHFSKLISLATSTNSTLVVNAPANLTGCVISNGNATIPFYVKFYNKASAPTVGTDTPVWTILVQPKTTIVLDTGAFSARFFTGIGIGITTGSADNDTGSTGLGLGDVIVNWLY